MDWFKPSSESVSFLAEICLLLTILFYTLNLKSKTRDTYLYIGYLVITLAWFIESFLWNSNIQSTPNGTTYIGWAGEILIPSVVLYRLWFAYQFGGNPFKREMRFVTSAFIILCGCRIFFWVKFYGPTGISSNSYSIYGSILFISSDLYAMVLFLRKINRISLKEILHPSCLETKTYRGFAIWTLINAVIFILYVSQIPGIINYFVWAYSFHILLLVAAIQSAFVFFNSAKEKNSFQAKLVGVILCVVLMILGLLPYNLFGDGLPTIAEPHPENRLKVFVILIPVATLIVIILFPLVFRYNILRPLDKILKGVKHVNEGDLSVDVRVEVNDEIGVLSKNFNQMTQSLREYSGKMEELVAERTSQLQASLDTLKSTQAQLVQSEKMASLGELTAGIAHEIQNPLNFVNNFSDVNKELLTELKDEIKNGNTDQANVIADDIIVNEEKINHHGKRADAIVKGMLQHSKTSSGAKEPTDINKLADEYLRLSYQGLRAKDKDFNAEIKTDFDESIGKINIVPQDIGRVLLNLYNNAFYAVNERAKLRAASYEPRVIVQTKKLNDKVEIRVSDNGTGIPQNIIDKIFQPFFTTKPTGQGTGLGLSLSYDIVKAHGGEIKVETKENEGTEFIVQLNQ